MEVDKEEFYAGIIDADTHISEGEAMWAMMDKEMFPRRPVLLKAPEDTLYGPRNAFWLIDGKFFPKPKARQFSLDHAFRLQARIGAR
jgi:hypothetical protein